MAALCERCGREADPGTPLIAGLPMGWEGSPRAMVCPGCQYAEWHPHCTSAVIVDEAGEYERVDQAVDWREPREETDFASVMYCDYVDLSVSWVQDAALPLDWTCPRCGGRRFEGVHLTSKAKRTRSGASSR